jgi:vacuolar-type H+-ATPase subunit H
MKRLNAITQAFDRRDAGYDPKQVDGYIQKLTGEYELLNEKYNKLAAVYDKTKHSNAEPETAVLEIQNARHNSFQIVNDANEEAVKIIRKAEEKKESLLSEARERASKTISDANDEANRIIGSAYTEVQKLKQEQRITAVSITNIIAGLTALLPAEA